MQEFWTTKGLTKHIENYKCQRLTKEDIEYMKTMKSYPFCRILIEVFYHNPKEFGKEGKFQSSYNITTMDKDWKQRLIDSCNKTIIGVDNKSQEQQSQRSEKLG